MMYYIPSKIMKGYKMNDNSIVGVINHNMTIRNLRDFCNQLLSSGVDKETPVFFNNTGFYEVDKDLHKVSAVSYETPKNGPSPYIEINSKVI